MEEAWELAVVSLTKRYYAEELERQALVKDSIPEHVWENIADAKREAEFQKDRAEAIRRSSRLTFYVAILGVITATLAIALAIFTSDQTKIPALPSLDGSLVELMFGVLASVIIATIYTLFRNIKVSISSDEEISASEENRDEVHRTFSSDLLGFKITTKTSKKSQKSTTIIDDALLASENARWIDALLNAKNIILKENERLAARSRGNLAVGITIAILGVFYLVSVVFFPELFPKATADDLSDWLPRFSLFFFIQLFAVFFLRLYVGNEKRLQRNIEEVTNLHLRMASGIMPLNSEQKTHALAEKLASEDRCHTIKKSAGIQSPSEYFSVLSEAIKLGKDLK